MIHGEKHVPAKGLKHHWKYSKKKTLVVRQHWLHNWFNVILHTPKMKTHALRWVDGVRSFVLMCCSCHRVVGWECAVRTLEHMHIAKPTVCYALCARHIANGNGNSKTMTGSGSILFWLRFSFIRRMLVSYNFVLNVYSKLMWIQFASKLPTARMFLWFCLTTLSV